VRVVTTGSGGSVTLDDGSGANFGSSDTVWLAYGNTFGPSDQPTASGTIFCPSGNVSFEVDLIDAATGRGVYSGASSSCGLNDVNGSLPSRCSDLPFQAPGGVRYSADVNLSSGAIGLSLLTANGPVTKIIQSSGTVQLGYLAPGAWSLLVSDVGAGQAVWSVSLGTAQGTHGGAGRITVGGQVGLLQIGQSTADDVQAVAGPPDAQATNTFYANDPKFQAFGYFCLNLPAGRRPLGVYALLAPVNYYQGPYCQTVFYINTQTATLAAFFTSSGRYSARAGITPGMSAPVAERRLHQKATSGCEQGLYLGRRRDRASVLVNVRGGHVHLHGHTLDLFGGRLASFSLESNRNPVGLLFC
jgi:hypothetical protein